MNDFSMPQSVSPQLSAMGLNLQAVFDMATLPADVYAEIQAGAGSGRKFRQLILIGHGGKALWQTLSRSDLHSADPVDDYTCQQVRQWMHQIDPALSYTILYPGTCMINLQRLGQLAGWHHPTPFLLGINAQWGSWFAYRAVILANTSLPVSKPRQQPSPCDSCTGKPCSVACPARAVEEDGFNLEACIDYRKSPLSTCQYTCLARVSCPIASEHRYETEQLHYHYGVSLNTLLHHAG